MNPSRTFADAATATVLICLIACFLALSGCAAPESRKTPEQSTVTPALQKEGGLMSAGQYRGVAVADLDNDGKLDIVGGASAPGTVTVWFGDGAGRMTDASTLPVNGDVRSVAVADVNEDGRPDIIFSIQREASGIKVWLNQGGRKWAEGPSPVQGNRYEGVKTADVNRDGHVDIIAANATSESAGGIQVWLGDGAGGWPVESGPVNVGLYMDVALEDFNGDGFTDLAGAGWGARGAVRVWLGKGNGEWVSASAPKAGHFNGLSLADADGDGITDILAGSYKNGVFIFKGDGLGNFRQTAGPTETGGFWKALALDLDGDGDRDIVAGSIEAGGVLVWENAGEDGWGPMEGWDDAGLSYYDMAVADFNADGKNDLCAASFGQGVKLWLGKGGYPLAPAPVREVRPPETATPGYVEPEENDVYTTASGFPEYKIGPGDVLEITVWKKATPEREIILVRPDGKISFGFVEDLHVDGLTPTQLDDALTAHLKQFIRKPVIDVIVKEYRSKRVTFMGEIFTNVTKNTGPGQYVITGKTHVLEMLSRVGGPTQKANLQDVRFRRKDGQAITLDLYKAMFYGDETQDAVLNDGDVILIPPVTDEANRVYVFGEVNRPGAYSFTGTEMTLLDAVTKAGGFTVFGVPDSTKIVRGDKTRPEVISADLKRLIEEGDQTQNVAIADGDLVYVPRSFIGDINIFVKRISPLLQLIYAPANIREEYWEDNELRLP